MGMKVNCGKQNQTWTGCGKMPACLEWTSRATLFKTSNKMTGIAFLIFADLEEYIASAVHAEVNSKDDGAICLVVERS